MMFLEMTITIKFFFAPELPLQRNEVFKGEKITLSVIFYDPRIVVVRLAKKIFCDFLKRYQISNEMLSFSIFLTPNNCKRRKTKTKTKTKIMNLLLFFEIEFMKNKSLLARFF